MKKTMFIVMSVIIVLLLGACAYLAKQLQDANNLLYLVNETADEEYYNQITNSEEWSNWVSWKAYQDVVHRLAVSDNLIFYVEEVLDDPYIEDYLNSDERKEWAKYH
jgi:uncharacterized protein YxeA